MYKEISHNIRVSYFLSQDIAVSRRQQPVLLPLQPQYTWHTESTNEMTFTVQSTSHSMYIIDGGNINKHCPATEGIPTQTADTQTISKHSFLFQWKKIMLNPDSPPYLYVQKKPSRL